MYKVTKEATFDCAHMLSDYDGLCGNLHGHTYKLQLELSTTASLGDDRMLVDFNGMKKAICAVTGEFDHAMIFSGAAFRNAAEEALYNWCQEYNKKHIVLPRRSTCEDMSTYLKERFEERFPDLQVTVRLWETPTSFAEV